jgi:hypothetical protein
LLSLASLVSLAFLASLVSSSSLAVRHKELITIHK